MTMSMKFFICAFVLTLTTGLFAFDASPRCFKDLSVNFFQTGIVSQALSMHKVDQSVWTPIVQQLQEVSKKVPDMVKKRARAMSPNPLEPVFIPEAAYSILTDVLFEVFSGVLISYNAYQDIRINGDDIKNMFDYIMSKQTSRFENCFGPQKK